METVVLKFGGSSVADNIKLNFVAERIKEFYNNKNRVVVVVSAQGKTTDGLIKEANTLSSMPNERELDVLLSTGEQVTISKLSILLNRQGVPTISLTGWQAGIFTNDTNQDAIIEDIDTSRILLELDSNKVVIVAGFQGINPKGDITTLGRGGSDTTAVAIAAKLQADHCYIFSDVDGVYTTDPNQVQIAKKIDSISYTEMLNIADEGAKVLHNRCVEIGERYNVPIVAKSTFKDGTGTVINDKIEGAFVKNIVKNDNLILVHGFAENYDFEMFNNLYMSFIENELGVKNLINNSSEKLDILFIMPKNKFTKFAKMIEDNYNDINCSYKDISRVSIVGNGMANNNLALMKIINTIKKYKVEILSIETSQLKVSVTFKDVVPNDLVEELHKNLI